MRILTFHCTIVALLSAALALALAPAWAVDKPLASPQLKTAKEYNYSNGLLGANNAGMAEADAGDFDENNVPFGAPVLRPIELQLEENGEKSLNSRNEQK